MWETYGLMKLSLLALALPMFVFAVGCAAGNDDAVSSGESNLDTSGCSGIDGSQTRGAVTVAASRPPTASCWNVDEAGLTVSYAWTQKNDAQPNKSPSFYVALNGGDDFQKAGDVRCEPASGGSGAISMGPDTSGDTYYTCRASKSFAFGKFPELKSAAYDASGHRTTWDVQVAVALDDAGNWDSLDGANYRFSF